MSGIGCSSRIPGYTTAYGFNSVHGRALPIAQGIKLANPELLVLVRAATATASPSAAATSPTPCAATSTSRTS
jgi:pyruvate/2-oxoacid:ferredoxin oxidoreductase beta subunit